LLDSLLQESQAKVAMKTTLLLALMATLSLQAKDYTGYKVLRTESLTVELVEKFRKLQESPILNKLDDRLDFWTEPRIGRPLDVNTSPRLLPAMESWLTHHGIQYHTMVEDLESLIQETKPKERKERPEGKGYTLDWDDYYEVEYLNEFIESLAADNDFASIIDIGKSYEGRDMKVLAIEKAPAGSPIIWLEAGIHAREWISPAVATFIVRELVEDYAEHPDYLDKINWYFIPSANPDGYAYTFSDDRMWRKTRSDTGSSFGCKGVDPNRNWGFHWGESGTSSNKCSEIYPGPYAFSEPEMQNIKAYVEGFPQLPVLGHCFHSYSQLWLWPYGYDYGAYPDNWQEIEQLAIDASDALYKVHGTVFDPINSADLYPAAGASDDWYKSLGMRFAFTTELRDTGRYGFVLPADQIIPSGEEMWAGFEVMINKILE